MKVTYRNGYPSKTCIDKLITEYFKDIEGYFPFIYIFNYLYRFNTLAKIIYKSTYRFLSEFYDRKRY